MKSSVNLLVFVTGCAASSAVPGHQTSQSPASSPIGHDSGASVVVLTQRSDPVLPPRIAMLAGLLPLRTMGIDTFLVAHPEDDGRGVVIGILDSGVDPGLPGLSRTSTGLPKIIDLRDFSGEGRIKLDLLEVDGDTVKVGSRTVSGFGRLARLASKPYYGGVFQELPLGRPPAADINGNGSITDSFPVVVAKSSAGWIVVTDTDADGSIADESPIRDYAIGHETFSYSVPALSNRAPPMTLAVNLTEVDGRPILSFFFDNSSHGTRVAGIAAGHSMFGVDRFDGVAPGAQIIGLKISNNARGSISVTGSMLRAMNYAANFAQQRSLPLVLNLSFGVGNEFEGTAAIDSIVNEFVLKHPDILFVIAAGNDGPGLSTVDFPGSAENALTVCALFPAVFANGPESNMDQSQDVVAWWSARGAEVQKPDLCAPGVAYSNVPTWNTGDEISPGTSFAAPQIAGAAALLRSAMLHRGRHVRGIDVIRSLTNTAQRPAGSTRLDVGAGLPNLSAAFRWLQVAHQAGVYSVRALQDGGNSSRGSAAYRREGLRSPTDTIQRFVVTSLGGQPAARIELLSDADWITAPAVVEPEGEPFTVTLRYNAALLDEPGVYVGTVSGRPASDTMAGASFTLTNTVVVAQSLSKPVRKQGTLGAGNLARYFLSVPEGAGGLSVRMSAKDGALGGTLYLFEPDGQPHRGKSSVEVNANVRSASIDVAVQDLIPGVYEATVVAPPAAALTYSFEASIPRVSISALGDGPVATVTNPGQESVGVVVAGRTVGATRSIALGGPRSDAASANVAPPVWADRMVIDVTLAREYWTTVTDFGVTVFDSTGAKLTDGPLNYSFGRVTVALDSLEYDGDMRIELVPAYAHLEAPERWDAQARISFLLPEAIPLMFADSSEEFGLSLEPGSTKAVSATGWLGDLTIPEGFSPLVEVSASASSGTASVRQGPAWFRKSSKPHDGPVPERMFQ